MPEILSDTDIINLVLKGNKQAYEIIVRRYQSFVLTLVMRQIKRREDAEEVAQDIFVKAFRGLADFKGHSKFSTWLYVIANTTCISFLRKKRWDIQSLDEGHVKETLEDRKGVMQTHEVELKSRAAMIHKAIELLSPDDAQIVTLFYKLEQSLEEIAIILGVEANTAKVRLFRARLRLKEKMEKYFAQEVKDFMT
jgi:RNA polymerase sigma-70 factor (ECF subfamily)